MHWPVSPSALQQPPRLVDNGQGELRACVDGGREGPNEPAQGSLPVRGVWSSSNLAGKGVGGAGVCVGISIAREPSLKICTYLRGHGRR